jgi:hypothetical protein
MALEITDKANLQPYLSAYLHIVEGCIPALPGCHFVLKGFDGDEKTRIYNHKNGPSLS